MSSVTSAVSTPTRPLPSSEVVHNGHAGRGQNVGMFILLGSLLFLAVVLLVTIPILKMVRRRQDRRDAVVDEDWVAPPISGPMPPMTPKRSPQPNGAQSADPPTVSPPTPTPPVATPPVATPPTATPPTSTPPPSA